jgi:rubrerythrin
MTKRGSIERREFIINKKNMLSKLPTNLEKVSDENVDKEILRAGIIAELDAINFYEQMAALAKDEIIKKVLLDIAREEKTHVGEFEEMLLKVDQEQVEEMKEAKEEIDELTK